MKLTLILFLVSVFQVNASLYSQNSKIDLAVKNITVKEALKVIENKSEYRFFFNDDVLSMNKTVNLKTSKADVNEVLKLLFNGLPLSYKILEKNMILIMPTENQQQITVKGTVTDAQTKESLVGVVIKIKGRISGTTTDMYGQYTLKVDKNSVLIFSLMGYKQQEVPVTESELNVALEPTAVGLNEVVITALDIKREVKSLGFAAQKVSGNDLIKTQAPNVLSGLIGKAAGVNITTANGVEGGSIRIVIRGNNSINGNNQPLIIVDGIPIENNYLVNNGQSQSVNGGRDWGSQINNINPYDVEDMNILKGPAAAALYGARGANGVVLITTKKGVKKPGIGIDYTFAQRWNEAYKYRDVQNEYGFGGPPNALWGIPKLAKNANGENVYPKGWEGPGRPVYGEIPGGYQSWDQFSWYGSGSSWGAKMEGQDIIYWDGTKQKYSPQPNNQSLYYKMGSTTTHNISFSGGGEMGNVRVSLTKNSNDAIVPNSYFDQTTASLGSSMKLSTKLSTELSMSYSDYTRKNSPQIGGSGDSWTKAMAYAFPRDYNGSERNNYKLADGSRNPFSSFQYGNINSNLWWDAYENNNTLRSNQFLGSLKLSFDPTPWLNIVGRTGMNFNANEFEFIGNPTDAQGLKGGYSHSLGKESVLNFDGIVTFHKENIIKGLNVSLATGGTSWYRRNYQMSGTGSGDFKDPFLWSFGNYAGTTQPSQIPGETRYEKKINSVYSFLDLGYRDFLYLQFTGRNDWSSTLPKGNNSYFYPSSSLSFVFSELFKAPSWFSFGKVRLAYAGAATDADPYQLLPTYISGTFAGQPTGSMQTTLPPLNLKPQLSNTVEAGTMLSFLNNRISMDVSYYVTRTKNQIMQSPLPISSGMSNVKINTGEMESRGIDIMIKGKVFDKKDFSWDVTLNAARNRNKLLSLADGAEEIELDAIWGQRYGAAITVRVGEEYGVIKGLNYTYYQNTGKRIVDKVYDKTDPTKVVGSVYRVSKDPEAIGNAAPKFTGAISNNFRYKNFSLFALVDYKWGGDIWCGTYAAALGEGTSPATLKERDGGGLPYTYPSGETANHGVILDGVNPDGTPNTTVVNYLWKYGRNGWSMNLFHAVDGIVEDSWIKLREISLTYDIPSSLVKKTKVFQNLSVSLIGRDLFYFYSTVPDHINPEGIQGSGNAQGLEFGAAPMQRSFGFSLRATF